MFNFSADGSVKKRVEDVMPIATGHEREELEAALQVVILGLRIRKMDKVFF